MAMNSAERLSALVQIPTVSATIDTTGTGPFDTMTKALKRLYPYTHRTLTVERITDLGWLYRWPGTDPALATAPIVLMAHVDVVPVDLSDPWTYPPFEGKIADGRVWGRGTVDDKGALVCLFEAVESLVKSGFVPTRDVYLSIGGNEETMGEAAAAIAAAFKERGLTPYFVLDEGGAVVDAPLPFVKARAAMVGVAEKGVMTVRLATQAEPGHASAPGTYTAVSRLGRAVAKLTPSTFPAHLAKTTVDMLASFVPLTSGAAQTGLKALVAAPAMTAQVFARMGGQAAALAHTTVAPTMIEGGTAANVLPSHASAIVNVRIAIGETMASALARIEHRIADPLVTVTMVEGYDPSPQSPTDNAPFAAIRDAVTAAFGVVTAPYITTGATDSRHFHAFTEAVYRFAPLVMTAVQLGAMHGVDEWVDIDSLVRGQQFYEQLVRTTAGSGEQ